jgi:HEAT repeat protein
VEDKGQGFHAKLRAILALGTIGDPAAVQALSMLVSSDEKPSRKIGSHELLTLKVNAVGSLGRIGDPNAIPAIENALENLQLSQFQKEFVMYYRDKLRAQ